jgi:hypothetical protein|uniref:Uncharacterized protein n=1 Tax=Caudovirales sp. ctaix4 TaxID=2827635 RepID=A0A8S5S6A2_9CAUD|nr:MAG TPA: hypothetical protein [Caudovirales sp. ctaix4]
MKTESTIKPSVQFEIEAFPEREGVECTVVLYDNVQGPFEKPSIQEGAAAEQYYTYDRYETKTTFHSGLKDNVKASVSLWIEQAKKDESAQEQPTEMEVLKKEVATLRKENNDLNAVVDELIVASLGGDAIV